jgi:hypothetical protein
MNVEKSKKMKYEKKFYLVGESIKKMKIRNFLFFDEIKGKFKKSLSPEIYPTINNLLG